MGPIHVFQEGSKGEEACQSSKRVPVRRWARIYAVLGGRQARPFGSKATRRDGNAQISTTRSEA
jgi:hypothetical protein